MRQHYETQVILFSRQGMLLYEDKNVMFFKVFCIALVPNVNSLIEKTREHRSYCLYSICDIELPLPDAKSFECESLIEDLSYTVKHNYKEILKGNTEFN